MSETIQRATQAHAVILAAIHASAFPPAEAWGADAMSLQLALPGVFGLLDGRGGMLLARVAAEDAEVLTLAVEPGVRRRGDRAVAAAGRDRRGGRARRHGACSLR